MRKDLEPKIQKDLSDILKESIQFAMQHREEAITYSETFGRGLNRDLTDRFVGMYVNHFSEELGEKGRHAIQVLLDKAFEHKLLPKKVQVEFVD